MEIDRTRLNLIYTVESLGCGLDGSIDSVIDKLLKIKKKAIDSGYSDIRIDLDQWGYNDGWEFSVTGSKVEDDETYNNRIKELELDAKEKEQERIDRQRELEKRNAQQRETDLKKFNELAKKLGITVQ